MRGNPITLSLSALILASMAAVLAQDPSPHACEWVGISSGQHNAIVGAYKLDARLTERDAEGCGRVEVYRDGMWGAVCDSEWGDDDAQVACRQLGFPGGGHAPVGGYTGGETASRVWMDDLRCSSTEDNLWGCPRGGDGAPGCRPASACCVDELQVRLANERDGCGRLEVMRGGVWGTVCDTGFDDVDAGVVCRQLGLIQETAASFAHSYRGQGTGPIWMNQVECTGDESSLGDCPRDDGPISDSVCVHSEDVSVCCEAPDIVRLADSDSDGCGRVEVLYNGTWGNVCGDGWGAEEAQVVCRQLGYGGGTPVAGGTAGKHGEGAGEIWLTNLACTGTEGRLGECTTTGGFSGWGETGCSHGEDAGVCCIGVPPPACSGSTEVLTAQAGRFHEGEGTGGYSGENRTCKWVIVPNVGGGGVPGVELTFEVFDTASGTDVVGVYECDDPSCEVVVSLSANLSGAPGGQRTFTSGSGFIMVNMSSSASGAGFEASWRPVVTSWRAQSTGSVLAVHAHASVIRGGVPRLNPLSIWTIPSLNLSRSAGGCAAWSGGADVSASCVPLFESVMLTGSSELFSIGSNFWGELGHTGLQGTSTTLTNDANPYPLRIPGTWQSVKGGCTHGIAISISGKAMAWGQNTAGQLGSSQGVGVTAANPVPQSVPLTSSATHVAAGGDFSVVAVSGGAVYTFGGNGHGQLGRATPSGGAAWNPSPQRVVASGGFSGGGGVFAGRHHAVAIDGVGRAWSWGRNHMGQLARQDSAGGDLAPAMVNSSAWVGDGAAGVGVSMAALGRHFTLLLTTVGDVYCAGSNLWGQCGANSGAPGEGGANPSPAKIPLPEGQTVSSVAAGQYHSLLQVMDGRVYGLGKNAAGQLASPTGFSVLRPVSTPLCISCALPASASVPLTGEALAGGEAHSLLLALGAASSTGAVYGAGDGGDGELGEGGGGSVLGVAFGGGQGGCGTKLEVPGVGGGCGCYTGPMVPSGVAAGCSQSFFTTLRPPCPPGTSSDTGRQPCAPCPGGTFQDSGGATLCSPCPPGSFSYNGSRSCSQCPDGTATVGPGSSFDDCLAVCQPGSYGSNVALNPTRGLAPCTLCPVNNYSTGEGAVSCPRCALGTGTEAEGSTSLSQCKAECSPGTSSATGLEPCLDCSAGKYQNDARSTSCIPCSPGTYVPPGSAAVECTACAPGSASEVPGSQQCNLCDFGSYQPSTGQVSCVSCPPMKSVANRGSTSSSECVTVNTATFTFGSDSTGQLGGGAGGGEVFMAANDIANGENKFENQAVVDASAGHSHTLALSLGPGGQISAWGFGDASYGETGVAPGGAPGCSETSEQSCPLATSFSRTPSRIQMPGGYTATLRKCIAGRRVSYFITDQGGVLSMGYNRYGQLGRPENVGVEGVGSASAEPILSSAFGGQKVASLSAGRYHAAAVTEDGGVYTWGKAENGRLGPAPEPSAGYVASPVLVPRASFLDWGVGAVSCGGSHTLVLSLGGDVWSFGSNRYGQLGVSAGYGDWSAATGTPQRVPLPGKAAAVAAGGYHSVAVMVNGEVYAWGSNMQGQLGMSAGGSSGGYRLWRVGSDSPQGPFSGIAPLPQAIGASCGSKHTLVWSQGTAWLFGANSKGQLGSAAGSVNDFNGVPIAKTLCSLANLCPPMSDQFRISFADAGSEHSLIRYGLWCGAGEQSRFGSCEVCAAGEFAPPEGGATSCTDCSAGTFSPALKATSCSTCRSGNYSSSGATACTRCADGTTTRSDGAGSANDCVAVCPRGTFGNLTQVGGLGSLPCYPCPTGTFAPSPGMQSCYPCPLGTYSGAQTGAYACSDCPPGRSTLDTGAVSQSSCLDTCLAGQYGERGFGPCFRCPDGTFSPTDGSSYCTPCPAGFNTSQGQDGTTGATRCNRMCPAGRISLSGFCSEDTGPCTGCSACVGGTYSPPLQPSTACYACPPGSVAHGAGNHECSQCPPGTYQDSSQSGGGEVCWPCPAGRSNSRSSATSCDPCSSGHYSDTTGAITCTSCNATFGPGSASDLPFGSTSCSICLPGEFAPFGASQCTQCPPGTFAPERSAGCTMCPIGSYSSLNGSTQCTECPAGTTLSIGSTMVIDCIWFTDAVATFGVPKASAVSSLSLAFLLRVPLTEGAVIELSLPGFTIADATPALGGPSGGFLSASWRNATEALPYDGLSLSLLRPVAPLSRLELVLAGDSGLRLPGGGVPPAQVGAGGGMEEVWLGGRRPLSMGAGGLGEDAQIQHTQAVGSFGDTPTVMFDEAMGTLTLSFMPSMPLSPGESISISAPSLSPSSSSSSSSSSLPLGGRDPSVFGGFASWRSPSVIRLTLAASLSPGDGVSIVIRGLTTSGGSGVFMISSDAAGGPVPQTLVLSVCKVTSEGYTRCCRGSASCL